MGGTAGVGGALVGPSGAGAPGKEGGEDKAGAIPVPGVGGESWPVPGVGTAGAIVGFVDEGESDGTAGVAEGRIDGVIPPKLGETGETGIGTGLGAFGEAGGGVFPDGATLGGGIPGGNGAGVGPPGWVTVGAGIPGWEKGDLVTLNFGADEAGAVAFGVSLSP